MTIFSAKLMAVSVALLSSHDGVKGLGEGVRGLDEGFRGLSEDLGCQRT